MRKRQGKYALSSRGRKLQRSQSANRLCRPARKRGTALLLQSAAAAFTTTDAALFGSFSGGEKERSHSYPVHFLFVNPLFEISIRLEKFIRFSY